MRARVDLLLARLAAVARRRHESQSGFTLIEVISTVVIIGIIALPLGAAMVFGLRSAFDTQESLARTTDVRQLSAYFPADVQSVDAAGVNPTDSNNVNICAANPLADETSLITFVWDEDLGISDQSMARYLAVGSGKDSQIVRRFCRGAADPTQPASDDNDWNDIVLAQHFGESDGKAADEYLLTTDPAAPDPGGPTPQCTSTSCFIEIRGAYDYRLNANRRVPGQDPDARPPDAPSDVHGVPGNQKVTLYWTDGNDNGSDLTQYTIETSSSGGSSAALHNVTGGVPNGSSGIQIGSLTNATAYKFRVKATNAAGTSPWSQWSDTIVPGPTTPDPPTVGTATASSTTNGEATLTWSLPSGYDDGGAALVGFRVYAVDAPNAPVTVDVDNPAATSGTVTGLVDNTQYLMQVSARNVYGEGSPSAAANPIVTLPSAPGTPNAQYGGSTGTVTLTFNPPTTGDFAYLTNFRAKVSSRADAEDAVAAATACPTGAAGTCTLQVTGLSSGETYSISVQAQNSAGWGPLSEPATAEVTPPTIGSSTIAPVGGTNGGYIGSGNPYYVYANATDASGVATVTANVDNLTPGGTSVPMIAAGGPWTIGGTSYTYRSGSVTADASLSAGSKSYSISATDTFANTATASFSVTVDNTPPNVTLTQVNGSTRTFPWATNAAGLTSVGGACTSGAGNDTTVTVTVSGPTPQTADATCSSSTWSHTFASPITTEGVYDFSASQRDYAGNTGTSGDRQVELDRTGPTVDRSVIASTADTGVGGYIRSGGSYYIYANVTDSISGVASVSANTTNITSGSTNVALTSGSYTVAGQTYNYRSASRTASSITAGSKSYTITATDNAGGSSGAQPFNVTVDATAPTISAAAIGASGAPEVGYVGQGKQYYVYANVSDAAGILSVTANVATNTSNTITTGQTAVPLVEGSYTVGANTYGYRSAVLTANASLSTSTNPKTFTVTATDVATLTTTSSPTVIVDNTSPSVSITRVNGNAVGSWPYSTNVNVTSVGGTCTTSFSDIQTVDVTIAGAEDETGTATCSSGAWTYTLSSPWSAEGSSTIDASQSDYAGNTGNATQRTVTLDKTVPVVTLTAPANDSITNDTTPSLAGTCTAGQGNVSVAITGPSPQTVNNITCSGGNWSSTSPTLTAGSYAATASQTDAAGNTGTSSTNDFTVDTTAPTVAATIARVGVTTGGYLAQGQDYYVYANATDAVGIDTVTANVAVSSNVLTSGATATPLTTTGGPWVIGGTSYSYRSTALTANSSISAGNKTYQVRATDNAGNSANPNQTVVIDNTAPAPTVTQVNGSTRTFPYTTNANVTSVGGTCGSASSDIALVSVTLAGVEDETGTAACASGAWTFTLSSAWSAEGSSTIVATQEDYAGNTGTSPSRTVSIDKTTPVVSETVMASTTDTTVGGYVKQGGSYYVYADVSDADSSISSVTANVNNVTSGSTSVTLSSGSFTVAGTSYNYRSSALTASNPLSAGTKTYTVTATDSAGNSDTTPNQNVTVDNTAPAPSAFSLANGDQLGRIDPDDSFTVTYNSDVNPNTICSGLTHSNNVTGVSITLNGNGSGNDTLSAPGSPCANFFSAVNLGRSYYSMNGTRTLTTTFDWNDSNNSVTVTITALSSTSSRQSGVSAGTPTYTPKSSILDPAGNAMGTSTFTGSSSRF